MKLLISTHNDDAALFAAFTIQRENCQVVTVFDSSVQSHRGFKECSAQVRRDEDIQACKCLGVDPPIFLGMNDAAEYTPHLEENIIVNLMRRFKDVEAVWCPAEEENGHPQHNMVSRASRAAFGFKVKDQYLSYRSKPCEKSVSDKKVEVKPEWIIPKLLALTCYKTQITIPELGCWPHFLRSQEEYYL